MEQLQENQLVSELKNVVGDDYVLTSQEDLAVYECDGDTLDVARPDIVVLPGSSAEVASVIKLANSYGVPFTARGAGTGLSGGATTVNGGISLVLTRLTKIVEIDPDNLVAVVQVGATNSSVSKAAEKYGLYFAPDPSSQMASTIGGNIAENAGGPHTLKYGITVNHVNGVKVILPDGSATVFGGKARDCLGLDLLGVFIGSEGTLGVATEVFLRLTPRPESAETMLAFFSTVGSGGEAVSEIVATGVTPAAMEMVDQLTLRAVEDAHHLGLDRDAGAVLIVELDGSKLSIESEKKVVCECALAHGAFGIKWAATDAERAAIWKARKTAFGSLGRIAPNAYVLDGVIPRSKLAEAIRRIAEIGTAHSVTIANIYHAGDGNLHPTLLYRKSNKDEVVRVMQAGREILQLCVTLGGTLSGEHGIGIEKLSEMTFLFSDNDLKAMGWLHEAFNPDGLCNPGKLVPTLKSCGESGTRELLRYKVLS